MGNPSGEDSFYYCVKLAGKQPLLRRLIGGYPAEIEPFRLYGIEPLSGVGAPDPISRRIWNPFVFNRGGLADPNPGLLLIDSIPFTPMMFSIATSLSCGSANSSFRSSYFEFVETPFEILDFYGDSSDLPAVNNGGFYGMVYADGTYYLFSIAIGYRLTSLGAF